MAVRSRWVALGASLAMVLGAGGVLTSAAGSVVSSFVPIAPCRLFDTRAGSDNVGPRSIPLGAGETYVSAVWGDNGKCSVPTGATGVTMNVAIVNPSAASYLTVFPADAATRPLAANLNWVAGQAPTPNAVTAALSADGRLGFYNLAGTVDLAVDVNGYYVAATAGPAGPPGAPGVDGPRGFSAWDTIPSGVTVTGSLMFDHQTAGDDGTDSMAIDLPGIAPVALRGFDVNFAAVPSFPQVGDADVTCTGSYLAPNAPAGKVCIYLSTSGGILDNSLAGYAGVPATRSFVIIWLPVAAPGLDEYLIATWAYTAP